MELDLSKDNTLHISKCLTENNTKFEYIQEKTLTCRGVRKCSECTNPVSVDCYISWELMDFCNEFCILEYQKCLSSKCSNCSGRIQKTTVGKYYQRLKNCFVIFCTKNCLLKYKSNVKFCAFCEKTKPQTRGSDWVILKLRVTSNFGLVSFCSQACYKKFVDIKNARLIIPHGKICSVCKVDRNIATILEHEQGPDYFCGQRCLVAFSYVNLKTTAENCIVCKKYFSKEIIDEHTVYNINLKLCFCSNNCMNIYMLLQRKRIRCNWCQNYNFNFSMVTKYSKIFPSISYFCSVHCLKVHEGSTANLKKCSIQLQKLSNSNNSQASSSGQNQINGTSNSISYPPVSNVKVNRQKQIIVSQNNKIIQRNVATMCTIPKVDKGIDVKPLTLNKKLQSDISTTVLLPIPVPIYIPTPMAMYSLPVPVAVPIPIPIPVPIFIPITRNSSKSIGKEIEQVCSKIPKNPYEAELLEIANMLAVDKTEVNSDSASEPQEFIDDNEMKWGAVNENNFDLEWALPDSVTELPVNTPVRQADEGVTEKGKRKARRIFSSKNKKKCDRTNDEPSKLLPDAVNMRLDYTLGINAWKQWVSKGNSSKYAKKFNTEILQMPPEELSYVLCSFIKELRKPNGEKYAPDTIYYLCLGIQYYLDENGRYENIFFDPMYSNFTDCLDELARKFCALYDDESHFIVTRVEEEHLWETRQLGCYSPQVLLNTLIYFNTKYYYLSTVDEHLQLSFYHILKAHKKNAKTSGVMLRFYPKTKKIHDRRVYEQQENIENPLRCPVKLYEYYLSKCPEIMKNKFDVIYLTPEKYCVSDSPLWYSTEPLPTESLAKIINRVKMVKEINVALLSNN